MTDRATRSPEQERRLWNIPLVAHAVVVVFLVALYVAATVTTSPDEGANIGAGLVGLTLLGLGVPWSVPFGVNPDFPSDLPGAWFEIVGFAPAFLNVVLHAVIRLVVLRRRARLSAVDHRGPSSTSTSASSRCRTERRS